MNHISASFNLSGSLGGSRRQRGMQPLHRTGQRGVALVVALILLVVITLVGLRSEEHTSELQSLMRISYAVFCLKKKKYSVIIVSTTKYIDHNTEYHSSCHTH